MADGQLFGLFEPETGQSIQRFGAALGGQLPQFDASQARQRAEQREVDDRRRLALLTDNRGVLRLLDAGDTSGAETLLQNRIGNIRQLGGNPDTTQGLLDQIRTDPKGALSEVRRLDNEAIDRGIFKALPKPEVPKPVSAKSIIDGRVVVPTAEGGFRAVEIQGFDPGTGEDQPVKTRASEILSDGTTIQSTDKGVRVFSGGNVQLTGQDAVDAIKQARQEGIRVAGDTAAAKAEADRVKQAIKLSGTAFKETGTIRRSLLTIAKARQAIAEGAQTGAVEKFLPSIRESSIKLDNLMNQLGLEVISGTTFGALSEGELRLALDTALPTGLQPAALDRWLIAKQDAQTKLLKELEDDIIELSSGGTIASIVRKRRRQREQPAATPAVSPQPVTSAQPVTPATGGFKIISVE